MFSRSGNAGLKWAVLVGAVALAVVVWSELRSGVSDPGLVSRALGPANVSYLFKAQVNGSKGPAAQCVVCHALDRREAQRVAPGLWGIVDAPKARAGWFAYSSALRAKGGTWTEAELDRFLADPRAYAPGTSMIISSIPDEKARRELIAYLKTLRD